MKVRDLKAGMIVYECEGGRNLRLDVLEDAYRDINEKEKKDGHSCLVSGPNGAFELFQTIEENLHHYGPRLYEAPAYTGPVIQPMDRTATK